MHISNLKESKYLKKEDCDPAILVTIDKLTEVNVALEGDAQDMKYCLHFKEDYKPMILNSTNGQLIARAVGSEETNDWPGKVIVLYNDSNVSFQGKLVGGIRARAAKKSTKGHVLPATEQIDDGSDSVPF